MTKAIPTLGDILETALARRQIELAQMQAEAKVRVLSERHDDILRELESVNKFWWTIYPEAAQVHQELLTDPINTSIPRALKIKRDMIAKYIIPTMYACIRAGWVEPKKRPDDPWEPWEPK